MKINLTMLLLLLVFTQGCIVHGPKTERKSPLNMLNGENYENSQSGPDKLMLVVTKHKERLTRIRGRLVLTEQTIEVPLKFIELVLYSKDGNLIQKTSSEINGQFLLTGVIPNGNYELKLNSTKYEALMPIEISDYELKDLVIQAKAKPQ